MSRYLALVESTVGETVEKPGALARVAPDGSDVELLVGPDTWVSEPGLIRYVLNGEPGAELIDEAAALDLVERFPWPGMRAAIAQAARAAGMFDPRLAAEFDESEWEREGGRFHAFIGEKEERAAGEDRRDENGVPLDERGDVDVDRYVSENPRRKGEDVFVWQGRIVEGLDRETQSEVLYETRERYDRVEELWEGAQRWNEENGLGPIPANVADLRADLDEADAVARFMENAKDESQSPLVHVAYDDFKRQNAEMYDYMTRPRAEGGLGVRVEYTTERDPYPSAEAQAADLRDNGRIIIESGLGGDHSALSVEEYDQFRAVHDVFGHAAIGGGFDRHGEYQAWVTHAAMYTGPGRQAMSTEYHGVNSAMWAGEPGTPGTGMSVLLPDGFADPPWMRQQAIVGAASTRSQKRAARALVAKLRLDPDFAREFSHVAWHTRGGPTPEAFLAAERDYVRDDIGRFSETEGGGGAGVETGRLPRGAAMAVWSLGQETSGSSMSGAKAIRDDVVNGPPYDPATQTLLDEIDKAGPTTVENYRGTAYEGDAATVAAMFQPGTDVQFPLVSFSSDRSQAHKFGQWTHNDALEGREATEVMFVLPPGGKGLPIDYAAISEDRGYANVEYFAAEAETVVSGDYTVESATEIEIDDYYEPGTNPRTAIEVRLAPR